MSHPLGEQRCRHLGDHRHCGLSSAFSFFQFPSFSYPFSSFPLICRVSPSNAFLFHSLFRVLFCIFFFNPFHETPLHLHSPPSFYLHFPYIPLFLPCASALLFSFPFHSANFLPRIPFFSFPCVPLFLPSTFFYPPFPAFPLLTCLFLFSPPFLFLTILLISVLPIPFFPCVPLFFLFPLLCTLSLPSPSRPQCNIQ